MRTSLAFERQSLFEQVKVLREIDERPKNAGYWQEFIDRMLPQIRGLDIYGLGAETTDPEMMRISVVATIAAAYPGAKRYLVENVGMDRDKVEAYTTAQTFFLAVKRFYEQTRDEHLKWQSIPFAQAITNGHFKNLDVQLKVDSESVGWSSVPTTMFLAPINIARAAQQRIQQMIAILQTVEAVRMHGAAHKGKLPISLESLSVPVPVDPYTGVPLLYELKNDQAVLTGHRLTGLQYRIVLRFASPPGE